MAKDKGEKIAAKISREQNFLLKQWLDSQKTITILSEDFEICKKDLGKITINNVKFWKRWFSKSSKPVMNSIEVNNVNKQFRIKAKIHNELIDENEKLGQSILDFGNHINSTFELMDLKNIKPDVMTKILTIFKIKL